MNIVKSSQVMITVVAAFGFAGCAASSADTGLGERDFSSASRHEAPSMLVGMQQTTPSEGQEIATSSRDAARVVLDDGHFVVLWTRRDDSSRRRALAQSYNQDGTPRGAPVVLSSATQDVLGVPRAVASKGGHVVATFAAASDKSVNLVTVPLDDVAPGPGMRLEAMR